MAKRIIMILSVLVFIVAIGAVYHITQYSELASERKTEAPLKPEKTNISPSKQPAKDSTTSATRR